MSKVFKNGDIRSGYYRDQTFMMAIDQLNSEQFFAQLYANTDISKDPHSGGRQMNSHFATRMLNNKGEWKTLTDIKNSSSDVSCVAAYLQGSPEASSPLPPKSSTIFQSLVLVDDLL